VSSRKDRDEAEDRAPEVEDLRNAGSAERLHVPEGDALRYDTEVDLSDLNTARTQLVLMAGTGRTVLETGPATGYITRALTERGCRVTGIEIDPVAAKQAAAYAERVIVGDLETVDFQEAFGEQRFDVVMFGDVLEHLVDPLAVLVRVRSILAPRGFVVASVPNVAHGSVRLALLAGRFEYSSEGLLDRTHLRFFTRETIMQLFDDAGYRIEELGQTTADPFGTEVPLREEDVPPHVTAAIRSLPDADAYQFLVKAFPLRDDQPGATDRPSLPDIAETLEPLREIEEELHDTRADLADTKGRIASSEARTEIKDRLLLEKQQLLVQREHRLKLFEAETRWLRGVAGRAEGERDRAQGELDGLMGSAAYRFSQRLTRRARRWFPPGTLRGRALGRVRRRAYRRLHGSAASDPAQQPAPVVPKDRAAWTEPETTPEDYRRWIERFEPDAEDLERQSQRAARLPYRPLISIVVPVWSPPDHLLRAMVDSVRVQTYDNWELCIADGGSPAGIRETLAELQRTDPRVRVRFLDRNEGISGNTNEALAAAGGELVVFLDQTDLLAPFALYEIVRAVNQDPSLDVLYSDWDILSEDGEVRFNPFFTPEWSPDLLLSTNYMSHLLVVRRLLVEEVGGLRPQMDGAQDWDLVLRVTERTDRIRRVPKVLYHWRADPGSAVMSLATKPQAEVNQRRAVEEHLERRGLGSSLERTTGDHLRVRWTVSGESRVSIIIPTRYNKAMVLRCLRGIGRSTYRNVETIIVETGGRDPSVEAWYEALQREFPITLLWWEKPFNYSEVNNWAARKATGDILLFLNDDTEPLDPDWLEEIVGWAEQDGIGVTGAQLTHEDGIIQHGGVVVGLKGFAGHLFAGLRPGEWSLLGSTRWYRNLTAVTGACLAVRRGVFEEIGGWDESFKLCGSDVELCLRVRRAGYRIVCTPFAEIQHAEGATRGAEVPQEDFFCSLWHYQTHLFSGDPYFNPNLAYTDTVPRLRRDDDESLSIVSGVIGRDLGPAPPPDPAAEARALTEACRVLPEELEAIRAHHRATRGHRDVTTINWFIPDFENPYYGGIHTIFRFADHFRRTQGVKNRFVVIGTGPEQYIRSGLQVAFPELAGSDIFVTSGSDELLRMVPDADVSIATLWVTAYPLARYVTSGRKFYFVQDFEPMFYSAGAVYALAEQTYRMGFYGIANTPSLKGVYESYGGTAVAFTPCVDTEIFHAKRPPRRPGDPLTVFLYGRPGHPRNCYELAVEALGSLKRSMGDGLRVVTAGSWGGSGDDVPEWLTQLGLMQYEETAELYRRCDAGLVLSVSKHPTYIPMQLMACGALVVANDNPASGWLLRDGENCLLSAPTVDALADTLRRGLLDEDLRGRLTTQAAEDIAKRHADWTPEIERVYRFMCDPEARPAAES
jgi:GT2 family glycosyltransferase/2-polyprenyl-3-methyl-5-hydroxy-6-metoxy-1,4-benzoquinol methylase/glycosyltransferase involved in cell wall biosynthesis